MAGPCYPSISLVPEEGLGRTLAVCCAGDVVGRLVLGAAEELAANTGEGFSDANPATGYALSQKLGLSTGVPRS